MGIFQNRALILGAAATVVAAVAGAYMYAASAGVEAFEDYVHDNDLRDVLRYRDVSYSPLSDTITLADVDLEVPISPGGGGSRDPNPMALLGALVGGTAQGPPVITGNLRSLELRGVRDEDALEVRFDGYSLLTDPSASERSGNYLYAVIGDLLPKLKNLGVRETQLGGVLSYRYDKGEDALEVGLTLDGSGLAASSVQLKLARARKLVGVDLSELLAQALANPVAQLEEFGRIEFVSLDARLDDHGIFKRLVRLEALAGFDYAKALNDDLEIDAIKLAAADDGLDRQFDGTLDGKSIEALKAFQSRGGALRFSATTAGRPVRLSDLFKDDRPHRDLNFVIEN